MKLLSWCARIALFLLVLVFSVRNTDPVTVHWAPSLEAQMPLVLALLVAFVLGAVLGALVLLPSWWNAKRQASVASKALAKAEKEAAQVSLASASTSSVVTPEQNLLVLPAGSNHGV